MSLENLSEMSSKVSQHPKEDDMSSKVSQHPKEDEMSSKMSQHLKEDEMSSKVSQHLKEKRLKPVRQRRKENLRFRERNGAVFQVPDSWEDLYAEDNKHKVDRNNTSVHKKPDYYTFLQKEISNDIREAHDTHGKIKSVKKNKSRWNRKRLDEIESDKSMLRTWFEHGVMGRAAAPRYKKGPKPESTEESEDYQNSSHVIKNRQVTLGDYIPSIPISTSNSNTNELTEVFEPRENKQTLRVKNLKGEEIKITPELTERFLSALRFNCVVTKAFCASVHIDFEKSSFIECCGGFASDHIDEVIKWDVIPLNIPYPISDEAIIELISDMCDPIKTGFCRQKENKQTLKVINSKGLEVKLTPNQSEQFLSALKAGSTKARAFFGTFHVDCQKSSYLECCGGSALKHVEEGSKWDVIPIYISTDMSDENITKLVEEMSKPGDFTFDTFLPKETEKTPLCIHGIRYQVSKLSESIFLEAERMLEVMPCKQLHTFSEAVKTLVMTVEDLRFCYLRNTLVMCQGQYCRWNDVEHTNDNSRGREAFSSITKPIRDFVSFAAKLTLVESPRYQLRTLLGDMSEYMSNRNPPDYLLGKKFRKVLNALDEQKSKGFSDYIEQFVSVIFREAFILLESLPKKESEQLRKDINEFNAAAWKMRDLEEESDSELLCCGLLSSRKVGSTTVVSSDLDYDSDSDSDYPSLNETDKRVVSYFLHKIKPLKVKELLEKVVSEQNIYSSWSKSPSKQCPPTVTKECTPPEQCCHTETDDCVTPPKRSSPIVMVESRKSNWTYLPDCESISDESENESPDLTSAEMTTAKKSIMNALKPYQPSGYLGIMTPEMKNGVVEKTTDV